MERQYKLTWFDSSGLVIDAGTYPLSWLLTVMIPWCIKEGHGFEVREVA